MFPLISQLSQRTVQAASSHAPCFDTRRPQLDHFATSQAPSGDIRTSHDPRLDRPDTQGPSPGSKMVIREPLDVDFHVVPPSRNGAWFFTCQQVA